MAQGREKISQANTVLPIKLSRDKQFVEKLTDVVGLYLNPPDKALVLRVDEKSQDSSAGSHAAAFADEERALWNPDP